MKTYLVNYWHLTIETKVDEGYILAKKIFPERCFDKFRDAKQSLIDHVKELRAKAHENVQKVYRLTPVKIMDQETKTRLMAAGRPDLIRVAEINESGYAGINRLGHIVDRREVPDAVPVQKNDLLGIPEPKELP